MKITGKEEAAKRLHEAISKNELILIYGDTDLDGLTCVLLQRTMYDSIKFKNYHIVPYVERTHDIPINLLQEVELRQPHLVIIADTGTSASNLVNNIASKADVIIADHHNKTNESGEFVDNVILVNPTYLDNNKNLSGGCVVFEILSEYLRTYRPEQHTFLIGMLYHLALISLYGDSIFGYNSYTMDLHNKATNVANSTRWFSHLAYSSAGQLPITRRNITFTIAPAVNCLFRTENFELINNFFFTEDVFLLKEERTKLIKSMEDIKNETRDITNRITQSIVDGLSCGYIKDDYENILVINLTTLHIPYIDTKLVVNLSGLIANKLTNLYGKTAMVIGVKEPNYNFSIRDSAGRDILSVFQRYKITGGGHDSAFGGSLTKEEFLNFNKNLKRIDMYIGKNLDKVKEVNWSVQSIRDVSFKDLLSIAQDNEFIVSEDEQIKIVVPASVLQLYECRPVWGQYGHYRMLKTTDGKTLFIPASDLDEDDSEDRIFNVVLSDKNKVKLCDVFS